MKNVISARPVRLRNFVLGIVGAAAACALSANAHAEFLTYTFAGDVTSVGYVGPPNNPPFPPRFPEGLPTELTAIDQLFGSTISGYVTVDNAAVDRNAVPYLGAFSGPAVVPLFYMTLNGHTFSYDYRALQPNTFASVGVNNLDSQPEFGIPSNNVGIQSSAGSGWFDELPASNYWVQMNLNLSIFDDLDLIDSDAMPADLSIYDRPWDLQLLILDRATSVGISYHTRVDLNRYVEVPAPASLALFVLGLAGIPIARRRRGTA